MNKFKWKREQKAKGLVAIGLYEERRPWNLIVDGVETIHVFHTHYHARARQSDENKAWRVMVIMRGANNIFLKKTFSTDVVDESTAADEAKKWVIANYEKIKEKFLTVQG